MELPGDVLETLLKTGLATNRGEGWYLHRKNAASRGGLWLVNGEPLTAGRTYKVVLPEFVAQGNEQNLEFLGGFQYKTQKTLEIKGQPARNDVRDLVIAYMKSLQE